MIICFSTILMVRCRPGRRRCSLGSLAACPTSAPPLTLACARVQGLVTTIGLLAVLRRPLPALPVSMMLGVLFFVLSWFVVSPYTQHVRDLALFA